MNEKWEIEFFEWKDEIEAKFNNLSQKNTELEKKFEFMESEFKCTPKSFSIWVKKCKENKEQIAELSKTIVKVQDIASQKRVEIRDVLSKLKENIDNYNAKCWIPQGNRQTNIEEVLQLFIKECGNYLDTNRFEYLLEKLDARSARQTDAERFPEMYEVLKKLEGKPEKKEDSRNYNFGKYKNIEVRSGTEIDFIDSGKRNMEFYNKGYEVGRETGYKLGKNDSIKKFLKKELYELYLKDKGECYFKKITHPFTEYNNMIHRGMGMKLTPYDAEEKLIEGFIKVLKAFECGCGDGFDLQIIEEYEGMLNNERKR